MPHLANLDVGCYDREYAPAEQRAEARTRHLSPWPAAVDGSVAALDEVPPPIAAATLLRGPRASRRPGRGRPGRGRRRSPRTARLVAHLEAAAGTGDSGDGGLGPAALGADGLTLLLCAAEATDVDLAAMAARADAERDRLRALLDAGLRPARTRAARSPSWCPSCCATTPTPTA